MVFRILIIFIFISSCKQQNDELLNFKNKLFDLVLYSSGLELNQEILNIELVSPPGTWLKVFTGMDKGKRNCLFYKTPFKEQPGILKISEFCTDPFKSGAVIQGVARFMVKLEGGNLLFNGVTKDEFNFSIPALNISRIDMKYERFDYPWKHLTGEGITYYRSEREIKNKEPTLGKLDDDYRSAKMTFCHRVNEKCKDEVEYACDDCRFGWYEVVDYRCPQGGSKICGINRCGERGQPACLRGYSVTKEEQSKCHEKSEAGYCQKGLQKNCDQNGILICL